MSAINKATMPPSTSPTSPSTSHISSPTKPQYICHPYNEYRTSISPSLLLHLREWFSEKQINALSSGYHTAPTSSIFRRVAPLSSPTGSPPDSPPDLPNSIASTLIPLPSLLSCYSFPHPPCSSPPFPPSPSSSPCVIVDRVCAEALLRGADVFKPGVICASGDIRMDTELEVWGDVTGNCEGRCFGGVGGAGL